MKKLIGMLASFILSLPFFVIAQEDSGTYIDNLNVQDSSYMEQDLLAGTETASSGNTTIIYYCSGCGSCNCCVCFVEKEEEKVICCEFNKRTCLEKDRFFYELTVDRKLYF
jgi:ferredoxin